MASYLTIPAPCANTIVPCFTTAGSDPVTPLGSTLTMPHFGGTCHCEERSDEAISALPSPGIASGTKRPRNDKCDVAKVLSLGVGHPDPAKTELERLTQKHKEKLGDLCALT